MSDIKWYERRFRSENWIRKDRLSGFGVTLSCHQYTFTASHHQSLFDLGESYIDIEFRPRRMVSKSLALPTDTSHRSIGKPVSNGAPHNTQTCNMLGSFRKRSEEQGNIRQRSCRYEPWLPDWLSHQRLPHCKNSIAVLDWWNRGLGQQVGAI